MSKPRMNLKVNMKMRGSVADDDPQYHSDIAQGGIAQALNRDMTEDERKVAVAIQDAMPKWSNIKVHLPARIGVAEEGMAFIRFRFDVDVPVQEGSTVTVLPWHFD